MASVTDQAKSAARKLVTARGSRGILAAIVGVPWTDSIARVGDEKWMPLLEHLFVLLMLSDEPTARLVVGPHTILVQREGELVFAVLTPTGHAVGKSLHRMIRRAVKAGKGSVEHA